MAEQDPPVKLRYTSKVQTTLQVVLSLIAEPEEVDPKVLVEGLPEGTQLLRLGTLKQLNPVDSRTPRYYTIWGTQKLLVDLQTRLQVEIIREFQFSGAFSTLTTPYPGYSPSRYAVAFDTAMLRVPKTPTP